MMVKAEVKQHNAFFECGVCGQCFNVTEEKPIAVAKLVAIKPNEKDYDMVYNTSFVDQCCFEGMEFTPEEVKDIATNGRTEA
jgi:hypothetical protein